MARGWPLINCSDLPLQVRASGKLKGSRLLVLPSVIGFGVSSIRPFDALADAISRGLRRTRHELATQRSGLDSYVLDDLSARVELILL